MSTRARLIVVAGLFLLAASLSWSAAQLNRSIEPVAGWRQTFFATPDFREPPRFTRRATVVDLSVIDEQPDLPRGEFSVRWEGYWDLTHGGDVDLFAGGDDEVYLDVDGERILERGPAQGMGTIARRLSLPPGLHQVRIDYVQHRGAAYVNVLWAPAGEEARPFSLREIFPDEPDRHTLFAARLAATRDRVAAVVWRIAFAVLLTLLIPPAVHVWKQRNPGARLAAILRAGRSHIDKHRKLYADVSRTTAGVLVAGLVLRTVTARWPGLDPESLWQDDLVWGAVVRAPDVSTMLGIPAHAPAGFFLALRSAYALFGDPEWSLQLLPFLSGIVAIPVMALAAWRMTGSAGLAVTTAALVALNPLLAHYSIYVKPYAIDLLATALLALASAALLHEAADDLGPFRRAAIASGLGALFSVTSVFVSFPLVTLAALRRLRTGRQHRLHLALSAGAYYALVLVAYAAARHRTNPVVRRDFGHGFMSLDSMAAVWSFLSTNGRRALETGLPSWRATNLLNPETASWQLPFVGAGLVWLLVRRSTRWLGVWIFGAYCAAIVASGLDIYPLGTGRPDIYTFPLTITLFVMGIHALTTWIPGREVVRTGVALAIAGFATAFPLLPRYFAVNDVRLVERFASQAQDRDGAIISPSGGYLAAFYGPWPVIVSPSELHSNGTEAQIDRPNTLHLRSDEQKPEPMVDEFLRTVRPTRLWYLAFRTSRAAETLEAIEASGYQIEPVEVTTRGALYRAIDKDAAD
jgi:hypothetical protein